MGKTPDCWVELISFENSLLARLRSFFRLVAETMINAVLRLILPEAFVSMSGANYDL
jgi:hypothetical protein